jgi:hypothetical protein
MRLSPRSWNIAVAALLYSAVSALVFGLGDSAALLYRVAFFAVSCVGVLWATNSSSVSQALHWFSRNRVPGNYVLIFTGVVAVWVLSRGVGVPRVLLETVHVFTFFWACAAVGQLYRSRNG